MLRYKTPIGGFSTGVLKCLRDARNHTIVGPKGVPDDMQGCGSGLELTRFRILPAKQPGSGSGFLVQNINVKINLIVKLV